MCGTDLVSQQSKQLCLRLPLYASQMQHHSGCYFCVAQETASLSLQALCSGCHMALPGLPHLYLLSSSAVFDMYLVCADNTDQPVHSTASSVDVTDAAQS